jgi:hypothetical protein
MLMPASVQFKGFQSGTTAELSARAKIAQILAASAYQQRMEVPERVS